jgi:hypothetical protein
MSEAGAKSAFQVAVEDLESGDEPVNALFLLPLAQEAVAAWLESKFVGNVPYSALPVVRGGEYEREDEDEQDLENYVSVVARTAAPAADAKRRAFRAVAVDVTLQTSRDIPAETAAAVFSGILNVMQPGALDAFFPVFLAEQELGVVLAGRIGTTGETQDVDGGARRFTAGFTVPLAPEGADSSRL